LVTRQPLAGVPANAPAGVPRWTLTPLDWQKRGGAALLTFPSQLPGDGSQQPDGGRAGDQTDPNAESTMVEDACS